MRARRGTAAIAGGGLTALLAAMLAGCGGSSGGGDNPTVAVGTSSSTTSSAASPCHAAPSAKPRPEHFSKEPPLTIQRATYTARIVTNCGTIVVALDGNNAPHTVNSFAFLARHHYFDNTPCHRLTTGPAGIFVLQCGDPTGTGSGGPGYSFRDENLAGATYPAGTVAMANAGPNTNGSQFFFVYADTPLPPHYTPFGHVVRGLDILKAIAAAGEDDSNGAGDGHPNEPVVITSFIVTKG